MDTLEKVIKGLECCIDSDENVFCPDDCPYQEAFEQGGECEALLKKDALSLLKAQEPREVENVAEFDENILCGGCPNCRRTIVQRKSDPTRFCKFCGQAVKWDA